MSILDKIVDHKYRQIATWAEPGDVPACTQDFTPFWTTRPALIAEIKARSPSEGIIAAPFDPAAQTGAYASGGADAISVLTDEEFFGGRFEILKQVRALTALPLLCKDFILDPVQIRTARACGADMILLIVKILDPDRLAALKHLTEDLGMKAVIEVQTASELEVAISVKPEILLINNRDLTSFDVAMNTAPDLAAQAPENCMCIAASGIQNPQDTRKRPSRIDGYLIGTALMRSPDPAEFLRQCR